MPQGNYDHPSYITRQMINLTGTAGANGTSIGQIFPWDVVVHKMVAVVNVAGTTAGNTVFLLNGTSTVANSTIVLTTSTAGVVVSNTVDLNQKITAGAVLSLKNGTDATGSSRVAVEYNIAPDSGTWT